jgi:membrane protein
VYFSRTAVASVFGAAGSFALILLWLYFSSAALLFGAELTQVRARRHGRRPQPADGAVPLDETKSSAA